MADTGGSKDTKNYFPDVPPRHDGFFLTLKSAQAKAGK